MAGEDRSQKQTHPAPGAFASGGDSGCEMIIHQLSAEVLYRLLDRSAELEAYILGLSHRQ